MKTPHRIVFCLFCALAAIVATVPGAPAQPAVLNPRVDKLFAAYDKPDSPGCALAVIKDGESVRVTITDAKNVPVYVSTVTSKRKLFSNTGGV